MGSVNCVWDVGRGTSELFREAVVFSNVSWTKRAGLRLPSFLSRFARPGLDSNGLLVKEKYRGCSLPPANGEGLSPMAGKCPLLLSGHLRDGIKRVRWWAEVRWLGSAVRQSYACHARALAPASASRSSASLPRGETLAASATMQSHHPCELSWAAGHRLSRWEDQTLTLMATDSPAYGLVSSSSRILAFVA